MIAKMHSVRNKSSSWSLLLLMLKLNCQPCNASRRIPRLARHLDAQQSRTTKCAHLWPTNCWLASGREIVVIVVASDFAVVVVAAASTIEIVDIAEPTLSRLQQQ